MSSLAQIYREKNTLMNGKGCSSNLDTELSLLQSRAGVLTNSDKLRDLGRIVKEVNDKNEIQTCKLF